MRDLFQTASITRELPVGFIAGRHPSAIEIFEQLGIPYCCQGSDSLAAACQKHGLNLPDVIEALSRAAGSEPIDLRSDWEHRPNAEVVGYIYNLYQKSIVKELTPLVELTECIIQIHQDRHEIQQLQAILASLHVLTNEGLTLMQNEIFQLSAKALDEPTPWSKKQRTDLINSIAVISRELRRLEALTNFFSSPGDACMTMHALWSGLEKLVCHGRRLVHMTTNVLRPRMARVAPH
jgi:regulator of cell morphogenesis and NO signaling